MTRRRYVWRVTAQFRQDEPAAKWTNVRHYFSRAAANHRAAVLLGAVPPADPEVSRLPRAVSVVVERSAPVDGWTVVSS